MGDKTNLYIDMDSTMFDYIGAYTEAHYNQTGVMVDIEGKSIDYNFHKLFGISDESKYDYLDVDFFENLIKEYDGVTQVINALHRSGRYNIYFVTHAVTKFAYMGKINRLEKMFGWFIYNTHFVTLRDKHLLSEGIIIDDNPFVITECKERENLNVIIYAQEWNKDISGYRVQNWDQVERVLL